MCSFCAVFVQFLCSFPKTEPKTTQATPNRNDVAVCSFCAVSPDKKSQCAVSVQFFTTETKTTQTTSNRNDMAVCSFCAVFSQKSAKNCNVQFLCSFPRTKPKSTRAKSNRNGMMLCSFCAVFRRCAVFVQFLAGAVRYFLPRSAFCTFEKTHVFCVALRPVHSKYLFILAVWVSFSFFCFFLFKDTLFVLFFNGNVLH